MTDGTERGDWEPEETAVPEPEDKRPVVVLETGDAPRATRQSKTC